MREELIAFEGDVDAKTLLKEFVEWCSLEEEYELFLENKYREAKDRLETEQSLGGAR